MYSTAPATVKVFPIVTVAHLKLPKDMYPSFPTNTFSSLRSRNTMSRSGKITLREKEGKIRTVKEGKGEENHGTIQSGGFGIERPVGDLGGYEEKGGQEEQLTAIKVARSPLAQNGVTIAM